MPTTKTIWNKLKHNKLKVISTLIVLTILGSVSAPVLLRAQTDYEKKQIENKYAEKKEKLNSQLSSINSNLSELKSTIGETVNLKNSYLEQKKSTEEQIAKGEELLTQTRLAIAQLDEELDQKERDIQERKLKVGLILKQIQQQGNITSFEILFSDKEFGEKISELNNTNTLENRLIESINALDQARKEQEELKAKYQKTEKDQQDAQNLLGIQKDNLENLVSQYAADEAKYQADLALKNREAQVAARELAAAENQQAAELDKLRKKREAEAAAAAAAAAAAKQNSGTGSSGPTNTVGNTGPVGRNYGLCQAKTSPTRFNIKFGTLGSPVQGGDYTFTSAYGTRTLFGTTACHNGVDLANRNSPMLVAVAEGVVASKGSLSSGYGNFVVIQHTFPGAGTIYALYGHMRSPSPLAVGTKVSRGDVVGQMGTTGTSTGIHLHFTLIDGESYYPSAYGPIGLYYDPQDYISI